MTTGFPGYDPERIAAFFRLGEDFAKLGENFARMAQSIPGTPLETPDPKRLFEIQKRNMDAMAEVTREAAKSYEQLYRRQVEVLQEATRQAQERLEALQAGTDAETSATVAREALETVANQLAELTAEAAKANADAFEILRKQMLENAAAFTGGSSD